MTSVTIKRLTDWGEEELADLSTLTRAVYPPGGDADWPGRHIEWSPAEWGIQVRDEGDDLVAYAGLVIRDGSHDGRPARIGGVGGVKTHPDHRRHGYAAEAMRSAHQFFSTADEVDFGLLVCEDSLIPYYGRLGWLLFDGDLLTQQATGKVKFTFNRVMVNPVTRRAPDAGVIDLNGPPW
jgi:aminoglycoside 2'-N-acetyltransferase I